MRYFFNLLSLLFISLFFFSVGETNIEKLLFESVGEGSIQIICPSIRFTSIEEYFWYIYVRFTQGSAQFRIYCTACRRFEWVLWFYDSILDLVTTYLVLNAYNLCFKYAILLILLFPQNLVIKGVVDRKNAWAVAVSATTKTWTRIMKRPVNSDKSIEMMWIKGILQDKL